jgi:uncharacterized protein (TIGR02444 family)
MNLGEEWPTNPLWDFSVRLYGKPGVAEACIALQETHGLDVNVLLFCAWRGEAMARADVATTMAAVSGWHDSFVRSLRALRTSMKKDSKGAPHPFAERVRAQIKSAELTAERIEQIMLAALAPGNSHEGYYAEENMRTYLESIGVQMDAQDRELIRTISLCTGS